MRSQKMDLNIFDPSMALDIIDITETTQMHVDSDLDRLRDDFDSAVTECCQILEKNHIIQISTSQGKDSSLVGLIAMEAMRLSIESGKVEPTRPLIFLSIDTAIDAVPMQSYVTFSRKYMLQYAQTHNINLIFDILQPELNDHFLIRWGGGSKLLPSVTRKGDCTPILKTNQTDKYIANLDRKFDDLNLEQYKTTQIIQMTGSRLQESARRNKNMRQRGVDNSIDDLLAKMDCVEVGSRKLLNYSPIKYWSTNDVMTALTIAGTDPQVNYHNPIPSYMPSMGLLVAIYGNGTSEACELSIGKSTAGAGCNGKARFGCYLCSMGSATDKSSTALAMHKRWEALGATDALRFRDYVWRMSNDMQARAFHARAYDPAGYNRIALQPNILKPKYLEKLVRYGSQLSLDSIKRAEEFKQMLVDGTADQHPGIVDIKTDMTLDAKTKAMFIDMYTDLAQQPVYKCFSLKHAALLSFRNALEGVGSAPFQPIRIWTDLVAGKGWIPFPKLNAELAIIPSIGADKLPDAFMLPFYTQDVESPDVFLAMNDNERSILHYWQRPLDLGDIIEKDFNCSNQESPDFRTAMHVHFTRNIELIDSEIDCDTAISIEYDAADGDGYVRLNVVNTLDHITIGGQKLLNSVALKADIESILEHNRSGFIGAFFNDQLIDQLATLSYSDGIKLIQERISKDCGQQVAKKTLGFIQAISMANSFKPDGNKKDTRSHFTRRRIRKVKGELVKGTTRLRFYSADLNSSYGNQHRQTRELLTVSFDTTSTKVPFLHDNPSLFSGFGDELMNFSINDDNFHHWLINGGLSHCIKINQNWINSKIKNRGDGVRAIRQYADSYAAHLLMNEGVISISTGHYQDYIKLLKRTELFAEIGALQYQSMTLKAVSERPETLTMEQHRNDKAKVIQSIRHKRNKHRRTAKLRSQNPLIDMQLTVTDRSRQLFDEAALNIQRRIDDGLAAVFGAAFFDRDINLATRAKAATLWFELNEDKLISNENFKKLCHAHHHDLYHRSTVNEELNRHRDNLLIELANIKNRWWKIINGLNIMQSEVQTGIADQESLNVFRQQWYALIDNAHPLREDWLCVSAEHWKPNADNFIKAINERHKRAVTILDWAEKLTIKLDAAKKSDLIHSYRKLTLKERLALNSRKVA